jgi:hypothetical protein
MVWISSLVLHHTFLSKGPNIVAHEMLTLISCQNTSTPKRRYNLFKDKSHDCIHAKILGWCFLFPFGKVVGYGDDA